MNRNKPSQWFFWGLAAGAFAADQITKWVVFRNSSDSRELNLLPGVFFRLERSGNLGIAWGLMQKWPQLVFVGGAAAALVVLYYYYRHSNRSWLEVASLAMILGGAAGNLSDRAFCGHVRDFLAFRIVDFRWPTFNIADTFITLGALALIAVFLRERPTAGTGGPEGAEKSEKRPQTGE